MNPKHKAKVEKEYAPFVDAVAGMSVEEMKNKILAYVGEKETVLLDKENNQKLKDVIELKKEIEGPYKDTLTAIDLKIKYLSHLISEKGGSLS